MGNVLIIIRQIIIMFLYMGIGALLYRQKLVSKEGSKSMAHLLLYVVLPCVVVKSFCVPQTADNLQGLLISLAAAAVILLLAMAVAHLLLRKNPIDDFSAAFSNAGFIGFPLVAAILGESAIFYAAGFVALLNALQWTYGQALLSGDKRFYNVKTILTNPLVIALFVGLAIFLLQLPVPDLAVDLLSAVSAMNAPLAMIILGVYLAQIKASSLFSDPRLYVVAAVRLLVIPLLSILVLRLLPAQYETLRMTLVIVCCAPVGSNVAVYAQKQGKDYAYAVRCVCLSTILSIVSIPLIMLFL